MDARLEMPWGCCGDAVGLKGGLEDAVRQGAGFGRSCGLLGTRECWVRKNERKEQREWRERTAH